MDNDDLEETIQHFSHDHPLKLIQLLQYTYISHECYCCRHSYESGTFMYECRECRSVLLCVVCAELGESIEHHPLHPLHPLLKLVDHRRPSSKHRFTKSCDACCEIILDGYFAYHCDDVTCDFEMHVKCAHSLKPTVALPRDRSHPHPLILIHSNPARNLKCESCCCEIERFTTFVRCVPCDLSYHIYCDRVKYEMPRMIMYLQGHPQHPLVLRPKVFYWSCDVCRKKRDWPGIEVYACSECNNFSAHISCLFQSLPCPFSSSVTNVTVGMRITSGPLHEAAQCQRCKKPILNELPVYGCHYCNFFIHESCISMWLPQSMEEKELMINDLTHRNSFVLLFAHGEHLLCYCCQNRCGGFIFQEEIWKFFVDLKCMLSEPYLEFGSFLELIGHDHPVILLQNGNDTKNSYLRCFLCRKDFSIAESSCRFPRTLLHECHSHPLTLVSSLFDKDADNCYCDVCEDKRDPNECIYYCAECMFEAHIGCVKSEVQGPLSSKLGKTEFVTLQEIKQYEESKKDTIKITEVLYLEQELQRCYTQFQKEFDDIFQIAKEMTWENTIGENLSHNNDFVDKTLYSTEPFKNFIEELNSSFSLEKTHSAMKSLRNEEVVRVREYLVPLKFDEAVETLFDKYGDFGASCTCSPEAKQYLFVGLCKALQSMCNTKIACATESLLMEWWTWFAMGRVAGFKIQFALESFKRVVFAHFGTAADKYAIGKLWAVRSEKKELPVKIKELTRKLEEKTKRLKEVEIEEMDLVQKAFRDKKSPLMKKCLEEANDLACYTAGETFLPPSD